MTIRVPIVENILNANDRLAQENHARISNSRYELECGGHIP